MSTELSTKAAIQVVKTLRGRLKCANITGKHTLTELQSTSILRRNVATNARKSSPIAILHRVTNMDIYQNNSRATFDLRNSRSSSASAVVHHSPTAEEMSHRIVRYDSRKLEDIEEDILNEVDINELQKLASSKLTPLSLSDMYTYGCKADMMQRLRNAQFLQMELPRRIARSAVELLSLPYGLCNQESILEVTKLYLRYLKEIQTCPMPTTVQKEQLFTEMLHKMVVDRTSVPKIISTGLESWLDSLKLKEDLDLDRLQHIENALYRFFTASVGLQFLTEHHVLSSPHKQTYQDLLCVHDWPKAIHPSGCIETDCDVKKEISEVSEEICRQTKAYYGICPEIEIIECFSEDAETFTYVPHHLHYMVGELLKNSCRATMEHHLRNDKVDKDDKLPRVTVIIAKGSKDVTIKVSDRGGGVPRSKISSIWKFTHPAAEIEESVPDIDKETGTQIHDFGLPVARIYARYFGGELSLRSMEGYGVDAYLHLPRLGEACENLPESVSTSPGARDSTPMLDSTPTAQKVSRCYSTMVYRREQDSVLIGDLCANGDSLDDTLENAKFLKVMAILRERAL